MDRGSCISVTEKGSFVFVCLQGMKELKKQVESLPPVNYNLLKYICRYSALICEGETQKLFIAIDLSFLCRFVKICADSSLFIFPFLFVYRFLDEVQSYSGVNKMSVQNLATVFGPNILRPKIEDPVAIMEGKVPR